MEMDTGTTVEVGQSCRADVGGANEDLRDLCTPSLCSATPLNHHYYQSILSLKRYSGSDLSVSLVSLLSHCIKRIICIRRWASASIEEMMNSSCCDETPAWQDGQPQGPADPGPHSTRAAFCDTTTSLLSGGCASCNCTRRLTSPTLNL